MCFSERFFKENSENGSHRPNRTLQAFLATSEQVDAWSEFRSWNWRVNRFPLLSFKCHENRGRTWLKICLERVTSVRFWKVYRISGLNFKWNGEKNFCSCSREAMSLRSRYSISLYWRIGMSMHLIVDVGCTNQRAMAVWIRNRSVTFRNCKLQNWIEMSMMRIRGVIQLRWGEWRLTSDHTCSYFFLFPFFSLFFVSTAIAISARKMVS